jgi:DNA-binding SARP family transcriptional activator
MPSVLHLTLLGPPRIRLADRKVAELFPQKTQALLYYLAGTGQAQPRSTLATLLWGDSPETAARTNLRKALLGLRRNLGDYLLIDRQTVALRPEARVWVDVKAFETGVTAEIEAAPMIARRTAVDLYQGP